MSYIVYRKESRANRKNPVARIKWYCVKKTEVRNQKQFCHCEEQSDEAISTRDCHEKHSSNIECSSRNDIRGNLFVIYYSSKYDIRNTIYEIEGGKVIVRSNHFRPPFNTTQNNFNQR